MSRLPLSFSCSWMVATSSRHMPATVTPWRSTWNGQRGSCWYVRDQSTASSRLPVSRYRQKTEKSAELWGYSGFFPPPRSPHAMGTRLALMELTTVQHDHLAAFAAAVRSSPHNLLSQRALDELEERHIGESLAFAGSLPSDADVLDLGTGGGFPGMVVAIARPDLRVTLLDSTTKKIDFLRAFSQERGLDVRLLDGRAEDLQASHAGSFDVVTARAVAPLERLIGWSLPFLRPGGLLYAIKGERWREELQTALPVLRQHRGQVVSVPGAVDSTGVAVPDDPAQPRVVIIRAAG